MGGEGDADADGDGEVAFGFSKGAVGAAPLDDAGGEVALVEAKEAVVGHVAAEFGVVDDDDVAGDVVAGVLGEMEEDGEFVEVYVFDDDFLAGGAFDHRGGNGMIEGVGEVAHEAVYGDAEGHAEVFAVGAGAGADLPAGIVLDVGEEYRPAFEGVGDVGEFVGGADGAVYGDEVAGFGRLLDEVTEGHI